MYPELSSDLRRKISGLLIHKHLYFKYIQTERGFKKWKITPLVRTQFCPKWTHKSLKQKTKC